MSRKHRFVILAALVAAMTSVLAVGTAAAAKSLVTAQVPSGQTVSALVTQHFTQTLTCTKICDVTTTLTISLDDAKQLGFKAGQASPNRITVASSYIRLKPNAPTRVGFVLSADGKKLLPKAKGGLKVLGNLTAFAKDNPKVATKTGWNVTLK